MTTGGLGRPSSCAPAGQVARGLGAAVGLGGRRGSA